MRTTILTRAGQPTIEPQCRYARAGHGNDALHQVLVRAGVVVASIAAALSAAGFFDGP